MQDFSVGLVISIGGLVIAVVPALRELNFKQLTDLQYMDNPLAVAESRNGYVYFQYFFCVPKRRFNIKPIPGLVYLVRLSKDDVFR